MAQLYDETTSTELSTMIDLDDVQELNKIENHGLDGTYYMQIVGEPRILYEIVAYLTAAQKVLLQAADANGDLLKVTTLAGTYYGRISQSSITRLYANDLYRALIVLRKEVV